MTITRKITQPMVLVFCLIWIKALNASEPYSKQELCKPHVFILEGTSSAGKTTTATALEKRIQEQCSGQKVLNTGFDALSEAKQDEKEFVQFLETTLETTGKKQQILKKHNWDPQTKILTQTTLNQLSSIEIQTIEEIIESEGTLWKENRLAEYVKQAFSSGSLVILDVLDSVSMQQALEKKGINGPSITTALLYVPLTQYRDSGWAKKSRGS